MKGNWPVDAMNFYEMYYNLLVTISADIGKMIETIDDERDLLLRDRERLMECRRRINVEIRSYREMYNR